MAAERGRRRGRLRAPFVVTISVTAATGLMAAQGCREPERTPPPAATGGPLVLPTWDELTPDRATADNPPPPSTSLDAHANPPTAMLLVTRGGKCFKKWLDPFPGPADVVVDRCTVACGTEIQCPPRARALLEADAAKGEAGVPPAPSTR